MQSTRSTRGASAESYQDDAQAASVSRGKVTMSQKRKSERKLASKRVLSWVVRKDANDVKRYKTAIGSVAEDNLCPITLELPVDPVMAEDGRIYERSAIEKHIEKNGRNLKSPATNERMGPRLLPAVQVRNTIKTLVESGAVDKALAKEWKRRTKIDKEVKETRKDAEEGDTEAMIDLGHWYEEGEMGLPKSKEQAYEWYQKAADLHSVRGMIEQGGCLINGCGVEKNVTHGVSILSLAAGMGSEVGAYYMGHWYMNGENDLPMDKAKAMYWLRKVTEGSCCLKDMWEGGVEEAKDALSKLEADL